MNDLVEREFGVRACIAEVALHYQAHSEAERPAWNCCDADAGEGLNEGLHVGDGEFVLGFWAVQNDVCEVGLVRDTLVTFDTFKAGRRRERVGRGALGWEGQLQ